VATRLSLGAAMSTLRYKLAKSAPVQQETKTLENHELNRISSLPLVA
jgi:hypothetical protein